MLLTGVFGYTSGSTIVIEDLNSGRQQHLLGHHDEIASLALQHDSLVLASASGCSHTSSGSITAPVQSHVMLWDLPTMTCKKLLRHDCRQVTSLAFSRDDRFLVALS